MDLPSYGSAVEVSRFTSIVETFLKKTPLTDFATLERAAPAFAWTHENLSFASTHAGRTMVMRSLALLKDRVVDGALGRATRQLFALRASRALFVAVDVLRDRALMAARARIAGDKEPEPITVGADPNDAAFAIGAGALVASHWIAQTGGGFSENERKTLLAILAPAAQSSAANEVRGLLTA
jgi:hypothetical protein